MKPYYCAMRSWGIVAQDSLRQEYLTRRAGGTIDWRCPSVPAVDAQQPCKLIQLVEFDVRNEVVLHAIVGPLDRIDSLVRPLASRSVRIPGRPHIRIDHMQPALVDKRGDGAIVHVVETAACQL